MIRPSGSTHISGALLVVGATLASVVFPQERVMAWQAPSEAAVPGLAEAMSAFWSATGEAELNRAVEDVLDTEATFDEVWRFLRAGPGHPTEVRTGILEWETVLEDNPGTVFRTLVLVPESYLPSRSYPVRVLLHGGVGRGEWDAGGAWWPDAKESLRDDAIVVIPAAWRAHTWWRRSQARHLQSVLGRLTRTYNVDTNRVALVGISDGGTGAYYLSAQLPTLWSSVVPLIAHPAVLANPAVGPESATYPLALVNHPYFIVSGDDDQLYPSRSVEPFVRDFEDLGLEAVYHMLPGVGHEMSWIDAYRDEITTFIVSNPRNPNPESVHWATDSPTWSGRAYWLVVESLGKGRRDRAVPTSKRMPPAGSHGRFTATRSDNRIDINTRGVSHLRVLLSPDVLDFSNPVTISINGRVLFHEEVRPSVETLLRWAAKDRDPQLLYGAEVRLRIR